MHEAAEFKARTWMLEDGGETAETDVEEEPAETSEIEGQGQLVLS